MKNKSSIIGKYTGKCCDGDVVNSNGMFLSRELFANLIESDEYKEALDNGYYIGFLGHPEDPDCQDFQNGCIVMTKMEMKDNGDIYGEFNLIDTPVGRIVKAFIDAGVNFGISIRGVGDVGNDGTVDPDTFVFRGFDLVSFPAYADCVPKFQEIAASRDSKKQKMYRNVCKTVMSNVSAITSSQSIDIIKEQFNENSPEYQELSALSDALQFDEEPATPEEHIQVLEQKVQALTDLLIDRIQRSKNLYDDYNCIQESLFFNTRDSARKSSVSESKNASLSRKNAKLEASVDAMRKENYRLKRRIRASERKTKNAVSASDRVRESEDSLRRENKELVKANEQLSAEIESLRAKTKRLDSSIHDLKESNLIYKTEVQASESKIEDKDSTIASLKSELGKTVAANKRLEREASNREGDIVELESTIEAHEQRIFDYQQAYADMCAYSAGVELENVKISAETSVNELKSIIYGSASSSRPSMSFREEIEPEFEDEDDFGMIDEPVFL